MSTYGNPGPPPPEAPAVAPVAPPANLLGPPQVDMMASAEMQAWLGRLQAEDRKIGVRNKYLLAALAAGVVLLIVVLGSVYQATIGAYAVIEDVQVRQDPVSQGRLDISYRVRSPGKVFCRRRSGEIETDKIDHFTEACDVDGRWAWAYQPGEPIEVAFWYRSGLLRRKHVETIPTLARADIVILMDTTESMEPYIDELKAKCSVFSQRLTERALEHRFALIGFGDVDNPPWIDPHEFTSDVVQFTAAVDTVQRFAGGDLPESGLDALEKALELPLDENAMRHFYLVTNAKYHPTAASGATAEDLAARLRKARVLLRVFTKQGFRDEYAKLTGDPRRVQELETFGRVLSEGRILED